MSQLEHFEKYRAVGPLLVSLRRTYLASKMPKMLRRPKDDPNWKPSIPDPKVFQLPNTVSHVPISIRPPEKYDDGVWPSLSSFKQAAPVVQRQRVHNVEGKSRTSQDQLTLRESFVEPSTRLKAPDKAVGLFGAFSSLFRKSPEST